MGFNDFLGIFVDVKKDETSKGATASSILNAPNSLSGKSNPVGTIKATPTVAIAPDSNEFSKFNAHFDELFEKSNLPGPDYFEFSKMVEALSSPGMTNDMKLTVAFAGLTVQGLTVQKLLSSAQQYLDIIDDDAKQFNLAIDGKVNTEIETRKKQVSVLE